MSILPATRISRLRDEIHFLSVMDEARPCHFPEIRKEVTFPRLLACSGWWFGGFPPRRSQSRLAGSIEHHLGECARTISSRDYASPGRFVFCQGERRSMVTSWARVLSRMAKSTRNCSSVRTPINSSRARSSQGKARSSSLVPSTARVGARHGS